MRAWLLLLLPAMLIIPCQVSYWVTLTEPTINLNLAAWKHVKEVYGNIFSQN